MESFLFVTSDVVLFEETAGKGALVEVTMLELDKVSNQKKPTEYRFEEADELADSLVGRPIYYGTNWLGMHEKKKTKIGNVVKTWVLNATKRIRGLIKITSDSIVQRLKKGEKFLFSVGGIAQFGEVVKRAGRRVMRMMHAVCTHLQMVPMGTNVGFPNARLGKIIEINETVFICEDDDCSILNAIREDVEPKQTTWETVPDEVKQFIYGNFII